MTVTVKKYYWCNMRNVETLITLMQKRAFFFFASTRTFISIVIYFTVNKIKLNEKYELYCNLFYLLFYLLLFIIVI